MSTFQQLIAEMCPEGVKLKALGEIANYSTGRVSSTVLHTDNYVGVDNLLPDKKGKIASNYLPSTGQLTFFQEGNILIGNIRPYLKKIWLAKNNGGTNGDVLVICIKNQKEICSEFLYYVLSSDQFFRYDMQNSKGAKMPRGDKDAVMKYRIPIPPLPIQEEIVRILDSFTTIESQLESQLESELETRKKQFEYYLACLFKPHGKWNKVTIGEVVDFQYGKGNTIPINSGEYPVYGSNGIVGNTDEYNSENAPIIGHIGSAGTVNWGEGKHFVTYNAIICLAKKNKILPKFAYYVFVLQDFPNKTKGSQPFISYEDVKKPEIYLPPLAEQARIVEILDRFDALTNDITAGIPAEIAARRKQYEYYRDKLLSFKEKVS